MVQHGGTHRVTSLLFLSRRLSTGDSSTLRVGVGEKKLGIKRGKEGQTNAGAEDRNMSRRKQFVASANDLRRITRTSLKSEVKYVRFCSRFSRVYPSSRAVNRDRRRLEQASTRAGKQKCFHGILFFRLVNRRRFLIVGATTLETLPLSDRAPFTVVLFSLRI